MNEEKMTRAVNYLLLAASVFLFYGLTEYVASEHLQPDKTAKDRVEVFKTEVPKREPDQKLIGAYNLRNAYDSVSIHYTTVETEYLGVYFITAYCAEECGWNYGTSSGAICHYEDDPYEPSTAAIDRRIHQYGDLFMIDGKVYIAEDTGAFSGLWIDCYVETMDEVRSWNTRYETVYSVSYEEKYLSSRERKIINECVRNYLFNRCISGRYGYGYGNRDDD